MKKFYIASVLFLFTVFGFGQNYLQINQTAIQQNNIQVNHFGYNKVANAMIDFTHAYEDEQRKTRAISRTKAQLEIVRSQFSYKKDFPAIVDGWHLVKITDNFNYCSDAKVFVEKGKLKEIVLDNYWEYSVDFNVIIPIKNAKAVIDWSLPNRGKDTAEIYFLYDLSGPNITDEPQKPGFITFWSDHRKAKTIEVWINREKVGQLSHEEEVGDCFVDGGLTLKLRPGTYNFKAAAHGSMDWRGVFEIKENQCYTYLLNRSNTD